MAAQASGQVRDGIMDAQAALHANLRKWERLAESGQVPDTAWRECLALILEGEASAMRCLRAVAPIAEAASERPRRSRRLVVGLRERAPRTMRPGMRLCVAAG